MTVVYTVTGNCGNYYCDGNHLLAVSDSKYGADVLAAQSACTDRTYESVNQKLNYGTFSLIQVNGPFTVGELIAEAFVV